MNKNKTESLIVLNKRSSTANFTWLLYLEKIIQKKFRLKKNISIALVSEIEIKNLNKVYRHKNKVTDVLSFNIDSAEILGEIVICLAKAKKQALEHKTSLKAELQLLTVHGILHLLGYDHELSEQEYLRQEKAQEKILALLKNYAN